jgi:hypothetical protein
MIYHLGDYMIASRNNMRLIGTIPRKKGEEIRVCLVANWRKWRLDIRCWYRPEGQEFMIPTKRGVGIAIEDMKLLSKLLDKARKAADTEIRAQGIKIKQRKRQSIRQVRR